MRYTRDEKSGNRYTSSISGGTVSPGENGAATGSVNDLKFSRFNPSFTVNYQWLEDLSSYAKVSTGYRAGGFIESAPPGDFGHTYKPEELTNYELGVKSFWWDHKLRANVAAFYSKLRDKQLVLAIDPANPSINQAYNAGKETVKGIEGELDFAPTDDVVLNLNYDFLRAYFTKVNIIPGTIFDQAINPLSPYVIGQNIKGAFSVPQSPKNSLSLGGDYTFLHFDGNDTLAAHLDYRWQDSFTFSSTSGPDAPNRSFNYIAPYGLLNGRVTLAMDLPHGEHAKVSLWGKNLTHKEYVAFDLGGGGSPATPSATSGGAVPGWAEPPSYGVDLSLEY
jgi:iron complex outermembrane receptor protein